MAVYYKCKACGEFHETPSGFYSFRSFESAPDKTGGAWDCPKTGERLDYVKTDLAWVPDIHDAHAAFKSANRAWNLDELFSAIDEMSPRDRDEAMMLTFLDIVDPQSTPGPVSEKDRVGDLHEPVNYRLFQEQCRDKAIHESERTIVRQVIFSTAEWLRERADARELPTVMKNYRDLIARCERGLTIEVDASKRQQLEELIEKAHADIANLPQAFRRAAILYETFCDETLVRLLNPPPP